MEYVDKTREQYDQEVFDNANLFSCCRFKGRGEYETTYHSTLEEARERKQSILREAPHARVMLYAMVVTDKHTNVRQTLVI